MSENLFNIVAGVTIRRKSLRYLRKVVILLWSAFHGLGSTLGGLDLQVSVTCHVGCCMLHSSLDFGTHLHRPTLTLVLKEEWGSEFRDYCRIYIRIKYRMIIIQIHSPTLPQAPVSTRESLAHLLLENEGPVA